MSEFTEHPGETLKAHYKHLHRHPELALEERETTAYIRKHLEETEGVELLPFGLETGVLARITGKQEGGSIALRADIDALPIREESGVEYSSEIPGKMHACGHDFHTSALLGAAGFLAQRRDEQKGSVYLLFQPAEEDQHGGEKTAQTGFLQKYGIREIYALHVKNGVPVGTIEIAPGPFSASVDHFEISIRGKGGHGSAPQTSLDPLPAAARLVSSLQEIVARRLTPGVPAVVSVTRFSAGTSWNIIPETAELEGTVRTFSDPAGDLIRREMESRVRALREEGYQTGLRYFNGCPATDNDGHCAQLIRETAEKNGFQVRPQHPEMGGEDFSCFQKIIPGALFHVGTGDGDKVHSPHFRVDLEALEPAARLLAEIALEAAAAGSRT